jgi:hypothetical protein
MLMIQFQFNLDKAMQVLAYLLGRIGTTDKVKLIKLAYLADREHFIAKGFPISGDRQCAMDWGPVPSFTLGAINGEIPGSQQRVFAYIHLDDVKVSVRNSPGDAMLTNSDREILDRVIHEHGSKNTWALVRETHKLPEYVEAYVEGTSRPIPYESISRVSGNENRYRRDRPVISREAAAEMVCPFPSGADI